MAEKYEISMDEAKNNLDSVHRMITLTLPVLRDNRFLIKIFEQLHDSMLNIVRAVLQYEYLYKRIALYQDAESNFETFMNCAVRYQIPPESVSQIKKIFLLMKRHKESPMEFVKKEKFVILSDSLRFETITLEKLREFYAMASDVLNRAEVSFNRRD